MSFAIVLLAAFLAPAGAQDEGAAVSIHQVELETARRIQHGIADPILGEGRASVFVRLSTAVKREYETREKAGVGLSRKEVAAGRKGIALSEQESRQAVASKGESVAGSLAFADFRVLVLHDARVRQSKLDAAREAILAAYAPELKPERLVFRRADFSGKARW